MFTVRYWFSAVMKIDGCDINHVWRCSAAQPYLFYWSASDFTLLLHARYLGQSIHYAQKERTKIYTPFFFLILSEAGNVPTTYPDSIVKDMDLKPNEIQELMKNKITWQKFVSAASTMPSKDDKWWWWFLPRQSHISTQAQHVSERVHILFVFM